MLFTIINRYFGVLLISDIFRITHLDVFLQKIQNRVFLRPTQ